MAISGDTTNSISSVVQHNAAEALHSPLVTPFPNPQSPAYIFGKIVLRPLIDNSIQALTHIYRHLPNVNTYRKIFLDAMNIFFVAQAVAPSDIHSPTARGVDDYHTLEPGICPIVKTKPNETHSIEWKRQHKPSLISSYQLEVESHWSIYVEESGNPQGVPVVFVHGGPGAHFKPTDHQWFDPEKYRIVLFQQRGTHRCHPSAEDLSVDARVFKNISIETLAKDMEVLRRHLGISKWLVFGGSWGSTLGLYYAQEYPESCSGLVLRGIFLSSKKELEDFFSVDAIEKKVPGWNRSSLELLKNYAAEKGMETSSDKLCHSYRWMIVEQNDGKAAVLWRRFEKYIESMGDEEFLNRLFNADLTVSGEERSVGLWECMLFDQIVEKVDLLEDSRLKKMSSIPIKIVHGKQDPICPAQVALTLASRLQQFGNPVELSLIDGGLHSPYSHPAMIDALVRACDQFALNSNFHILR